MLAFITTTTIKDGMADGYEALLKDVAEKSEALEPGCRAFKVLRLRGEINRYLVVEQYADGAAGLGRGSRRRFGCEPGPDRHGRCHCA